MALNHALGTGPAGFHAVNIAIHAGNAVLAFSLFSRLARREGLGERAAGGLACFGALLFALHPIQTEAVTYVSGRSTSLAALFSLASLLAWIEGRARGRPALAGLSAVLFAAALLVKETAVVVPVALLLWETGNVHPEFDPSPPRIPWIHFGVLAAAAIAALSSSMYRHLFATSLEARGIGANLATQANAIFHLAGGLLRFDRLNADPMFPVIDSWTVAVALQGAAILALLAIGVMLLRRRPAIAFGILWFFLCLAPTNSILPRLDVANDRQLYLALLGPAWLAAWAIGKVASKRRAAAVAAGLLLVLFLGAATHLRNRVYANEIVFWEDVVWKSPGNGRVFNNLGYAYALASRSDDAEAAFRRALALDPRDVRAGVNLRLLREGAFAKGPIRP